MMDYRLRNQRLILQSRRMRLLSNVIDDYQDNMRIALRLIERDLELSYSESTANRSLFDTILSTPRTTPNSTATNSAENTTPAAFPRSTYIYTQLYTPSSQSAQSDAGITSQQLEDATTLMTYDSSMNETRCPISLDAFEPGQSILKINVCGHVFSENALKSWCNRHSSCPLCRKSLIDDVEDDQAPSPASISNPLPSIASNTVNQLFSGILNNVSTAINGETSEISFDINDLLSTYEQLISSNRFTARNNERNTQ
jgi:rubrerythrin